MLFSEFYKSRTLNERYIIRQDLSKLCNMKEQSIAQSWAYDRRRPKPLSAVKVAEYLKRRWGVIATPDELFPPLDKVGTVA